MNEAMLTTAQVAERLGVTTKRVWALIKAGRLPSTQYGRDHLINEADLALVADRKPGRPKKADKGETVAPDLPAVTLAEMEAGESVRTRAPAAKGKAKKAAKPAKKRTAKKGN